MTNITERKNLAQFIQQLVHVIKQRAEAAESCATDDREINAWIKVLGSAVILEGSLDMAERICQTLEYERPTGTLRPFQIVEKRSS